VDGRRNRAFEARWPIGTRERLALTILLYTGLRRGDAVSLGASTLRTDHHLARGQDGHTNHYPVLPELAAIINASRTGDLAFIAGKRGRPMTKESLGIGFAVLQEAACRDLRMDA